MSAEAKQARDPFELRKLYERLGMTPDATVDYEAVEGYYRELGE